LGLVDVSVLVFGLSGQLARSLQAGLPQTGLPSQLKVVFLDRAACDLSVPNAATDALAHHKPDWIINAAAYTAVDNAESEPDLAHRVNASAVAEMATYAGQNDSKLIHVSTDFVFDGTRRQPYQPGDPTSALGVYGHSKLAGEQSVVLHAPENAMIIRTSWVYSEYGQNFVKTMLRLMAERNELGVVHDQMGAPTYAVGLADIIWDIVMNDRFAPGIYHWSDRGSISWYDFAEAIQAEALSRGLLAGAIPIKPIPTEAYPTPAARPEYSVLDTGKLESLLGLSAIDWRLRLRDMLDAVEAKP
jgi:dTDP-4-dehydrorhamnose reductase